jgi:hypothetical protein
VFWGVKDLFGVFYLVTAGVAVKGYLNNNNN